MIECMGVRRTDSLHSQKSSYNFFIPQTTNRLLLTRNIIDSLNHQFTYILCTKYIIYYIIKLEKVIKEILRKRKYISSTVFIDTHKFISSIYKVNLSPPTSILSYMIQNIVDIIK